MTDITIDGKPINEENRLTAIICKLWDKWLAGKLAADKVRIEIHCSGGTDHSSGSVKVHITEFDE